MTDKGSLRERLLHHRDSLSESFVGEASSKIAARVLGLDSVQKAKSVVLYAPVRNEVRTQAIFEALRQSGKRVGCPKVDVGTSLSFFEVKSWDDLKPGTWGILEPVGGSRMNLEVVELVLVPGVGFDENGRRIGFGKGYYDRMFENFQGIKIGLAYDFQILKALAPDQGEILCDLVVTESRVIPTTKR